MPTGTGKTGNGFAWNSYNIGGKTIYAVDFGNTEWAPNDVTGFSVGVTLYSTNDEMLDYASLSNVTADKPQSSTGVGQYYRVYVGGESYITVKLSSKCVTGGYLEFSIVSGEDYNIDYSSIVASAYSIYNASNDNRTTYYVDYLGDNIYCISEVTSNVYIYVDRRPSDSSRTQRIIT